MSVSSSSVYLFSLGILCKNKLGLFVHVHFLGVIS